MTFFCRIVAFSGMFFSFLSAAVANELPTSIEGRLLLLESRQEALALDFQNLRCLQAGGSEEECRQQIYQLDAMARNVAAQATAIQTTVNGVEIPSMTAAQDALLNCAGAIEAFGGAAFGTQQMSQAAESAFTGQCSEQTLAVTIATAAQDVRRAAESCLESGTDIEGAFARWEAQSQTASLVDVLRVAAEDSSQLREGAAACIDDAREAAESLDRSAGALMNAVAATAAFCSSVPEPYSCAIFGAIQLLMALFSSGDGGGGDGNGEGQGQNTGLDVGNDPEIVTAVAQGSGCNNARREGAALLCDGFEFSFAFAGASIDESLGNAGPEINEAMAARLAENDGSFAALFGDGKMVARGRNEILFCVRRLPGLPDQVFPDQWLPNGFGPEDEHARVLVVFAPTNINRGLHSMTLLPVPQDLLRSDVCARP